VNVADWILLISLLLAGAILFFGVVALMASAQKLLDAKAAKLRAETDRVRAGD
jgi:hypothetical protein